MGMGHVPKILEKNCFLWPQPLSISEVIYCGNFWKLREQNFTEKDKDTALTLTFEKFYCSVTFGIQ